MHMAGAMIIMVMAIAIMAMRLQRRQRAWPRQA
jgi:hypothetical protein